MLTAVQGFIPILSSAAGLCLTTDNWRAAKVKALSYSLESLLHKPGYSFLKKLPNLADYLAWPEVIILNALGLIANKAGNYLLKSPYDGSTLELSPCLLIELIQHLKPSAVILPKDIIAKYPQIWNNWLEGIMPFIHAEELQKQHPARVHGVYLDYESQAFSAQVEGRLHLLSYVAGDIDWPSIQVLQDKGINFIQTDTPAKAALQGRVYSQAGDIDLTEAWMRMQFKPIDSNCACPTCAQQLTRAYLHHLLQNTPLLGQRFLLQHNLFYVQTNLTHRT